MRQDDGRVDQVSYQRGDRARSARNTCLLVERRDGVVCYSRNPSPSFADDFSRKVVDTGALALVWRFNPNTRTILWNTIRNGCLNLELTLLLK